MKGNPSNKKSKKPHQNTNRTADTVGVPVASAFGCAIGLVTATGAALVFSLICLFSDDPDKLITPLAFVGSITAFLSAGFAASKKKRAALPCGLMAGGMMTVIFFIVSLCLNDSLSLNLSLPVSILIRLSLILVSVLGALVGVNTRIKKKRRH